MEEQVLTLILHDGNPSGIIECEIDEWFGICYKIPQKKLKEAQALNYINNTGIYILLGDDENTADKVAYIGETESIYSRLKNHNKNFWNECIVFMSENNSLNKAHIKYIEHELYELGIQANRFIVNNDNTPTKPTLGHADEIKAKKFINKVKIITSMLGYKIFDKKINENDLADDNILYLKNNGILYARGILTNEGFVILKDSKIKEEVSENISPSLINFCKRERNSTDIKDGIFINDHLCTSPSMAAVVILGRNSNGYNEWKNKNGKTLKSIINH